MSESVSSPRSDQKEEVESPEIHFEPLVNLAPIEVATLEENEEEIFKIRSKLFRMDMEADPPEWKERGVGDVRILKHREKTRFRIVMRREKTHKICCNHFITADINLVPNVGSDRAWVWSTHADYADEEPKHEQLAIRFGNAENAGKFKAAVETCQGQLATVNKSSNEDSLVEELDKLNVTGESQSDADSEPVGSSSQDETKKEEPKEEDKEEEQPSSNTPEQTQPKQNSPPPPTTTPTAAEDAPKQTDECTGQ